MIGQHYAGVIANWDGKQVPADSQIRAARQSIRREIDALKKTEEQKNEENPCKTGEAL